jgi:predicted amidohydrolase YtcJ
MQTNPAENINREQAVIAYTRTNAFAEFMEKEKEHWRKECWQTLRYYHRIIFTIPTEQLPGTTSVLTIVDGKIVYQQ